MSEPSRKLSTDEVSALMDGLKTGDLSSSTIKDSKDVEVKVFYIVFVINLIIFK